MKFKILSILTFVILGFTSTVSASSVRLGNKSSEDYSIFSLSPFERAICCIKYYEGMHRRKDYPYVGYGHKLQPGEHYSSKMSIREADQLLRKDMTKLCNMFSSYGKDSLLLAALAYNVGPYRILGCKGKYPKSTLLNKIEAGIRDYKNDYVQFCHWKGKKVASIERRRYAEFQLLYVQ